MKTITYVFQLILATTATLALTGCPPKPETKSGPIIKTVLMGDPLKVVQGATFNPHVDFKFFDGVQTLNIKGIVEFEQKQKYSLGKKVTRSSIEAEEAPDTGKEERFVVMNVESTVNEDKSRTVKISNAQYKIVITLSSTTENGKEMAVFKMGNKTQKLEMMHFSVSADGLEMSLLLLANDAEDGVSVNALYFSKATVEPPEMLSTKYNFTNGPGFKAAWAEGKTIDMNVCGANAEGIAGKLAVSVAKWNVAMNGLRTISLTTPEVYAPFTDLNQHCIYYVDSFLFEPDPGAAIYGITATITQNSSIVDSDIMLFQDEFLKSRTIDEADFNRAIIHEMGHMLGLDHQFDGTISVMSYDFSGGHNELSTYDNEAIQELYKR